MTTKEEHYTALVKRWWQLTYHIDDLDNRKWHHPRGSTEWWRIEERKRRAEARRNRTEWDINEFKERHGIVILVPSGEEE